MRDGMERRRRRRVGRNMMGWVGGDWVRSDAVFMEIDEERIFLECSARN